MSVEFRQRRPSEYLKILRRRKWLLILPMIAVATAVAYVVYRLPDVYESTTLIVVRPSNLPNSVVPTVTEDSITRQLASISQVVTSRSSLEPLVDKYEQFAVTPSTSAAVGPIPDIDTKLTTFKLWATYALAKNSGIRLDYIFDRFDTNDWTWTTWVYSDGTTVTQEPRQTVNFLGLSYYYRFQ